MITEDQTNTPPPADGSTETACAACVHPREAHDRIGLRYCAATVASGINRGCVCVGTTDAPSKT
jgi:hypothetical protein